MTRSHWFAGPGDWMVQRGIIIAGSLVGLVGGASWYHNNHDLDRHGGVRAPKGGLNDRL